MTGYLDGNAALTSDALYEVQDQHLDMVLLSVSYSGALTGPFLLQMQYESGEYPDFMNVSECKGINN